MAIGAAGMVSSAAAADLAAELREAARGIIEAGEAYRKGDLEGAKVDHEVYKLTRLLDSGALSQVGAAVAHHWRGRAYETANWTRIRKGQGVDLAIARAALADFDRAIAHGDVPRWFTKANTLYMAGLVARNHVEDFPLAYDYWRRCAELNHAGCLNIMATARLTGAGGIKVDLADSIELNKRVYETGTDFRCAGAYSALAIAELIYFGRMTSVIVNEAEWLRRAYQLLDELAMDLKSDNPCDRSKFEIVEFLIRLGQGEAKPELLRTAAGRKVENDYKVLAEYLLGSATAENLGAAIGGTNLKHVACAMHFAAAWYAEIRKQFSVAASHERALAAFGGDHCAPEIALLRLGKAER